MQRYFSPKITIKTIEKDSEGKNGFLYFVRGILALRQENSIKAISSSFEQFCKGVHLGITSTEKMLISQFRPLIVEDINRHTKSFIPELFNDEITDTNNIELTTEKIGFLYKYQALLCLLYNIKPDLELRTNLLNVAQKAQKLGDNQLAPKIIEYLSNIKIIHQNNLYPTENLFKNSLK